MRAISEIEKEVAELEQKLTIIDQQKVENVKQISKIKESNFSLLESSIGKKRQPTALGAQRQAIQRLRLQVEELEAVRPRVESKLDETRKELKLSTLYHENVELYETQEIEFMGKWHELETLVNDLATLPNPLAILRNLLSAKGLGRECNVPAFFDGKIEQPDADKNASFLERRLDRYRSMKEVLPVLGKPMQEIEQLIQGVQEYTRHYATRPSRACLLCGSEAQGDVIVQRPRLGLGPLEASRIRKENEERIAAQKQAEAERKRLLANL